MDNFDFKKELLLFLYENNSHSVEIHSICDNPVLTNYIIKSTIKNIKKDKLIDTDESYRLIGGGDPNKLATVKSLHVKARITPHGEQYVRNTYMKKNDKPQINVTNSVFAGGDINAPISQTNDHSDSKASQSIAIDKQKREIAIQIIKNVVLIISAIASAIAIYEFFIK